MTKSIFNHVKISGIKTVVPEHFIDIDDELEYFENNPKKLARAKKMAGFGRRYIADKKTTVTDLAVCAAEQLIDEMSINKEDIDLLIFANQKPDYPEPCDACVAHGLLDLKKNCASFSINLGCTAYVYALWVAHAMIASGAVKKCLLLAGDLPARDMEQNDRKSAPVFGDAASATILEYTEENKEAYFVLGSDGKGFDRIICPIGAMRVPFTEDNIKSKFGGIMHGEDVFSFTMDVVPKLIQETLDLAKWTRETVDLFAIHQANKQILDNIIRMSDLPSEKTPTDVFTKYANNSTNSVVTVLCDQPTQNVKEKVVLCTFGIGLSWAAVGMNLTDCYNGGIGVYVSPSTKLSQEELFDYWLKVKESL